MKAFLSLEIAREYARLKKAIESVPASSWILKQFKDTLSAADLIAYRIGWGKRVIDWCETGVKGEKPLMPGEGFSKWEYEKIAQHFYQKYQYENSAAQLQEFDRVVSTILAIVEKECEAGNLDKSGVWPWCTLLSGKEWPLSKWIRVNTASPFKRAASILLSHFCTKSF